MIFRNSHCTENYCSNSHHFALYFSHLSGVKAFLTVILPRLTIVQELAIKKRHQAYRIAAIVHIARLKPKS